MAAPHLVPAAGWESEYFCSLLAERHDASKPLHGPGDEDELLKGSEWNHRVQMSGLKGLRVQPHPTASFLSHSFASARLY